jgi:hypothetical protein
MAAKPLQIESIDRLTEDKFVLNFSDDTVAILTEQELQKHFADRRITAQRYNDMLAPN